MDFEVEYSNEELVQLVQDGQEVHDPVEVDPLIDDSDDVESKVVKLSDAQNMLKMFLFLWLVKVLKFSTLWSCQEWKKIPCQAH